MEYLKLAYPARLNSWQLAKYSSESGEMPIIFIALESYAEVSPQYFSNFSGFKYLGSAVDRKFGYNDLMTNLMKT